MKTKKFKAIPKFKNSAEEFEFWQKADTAKYFDYSRAVRGVGFPNLKLTSKLVTMRMPLSLIERVKVEANKIDMPYQALIRQMIFKGLQTL